MTDKDRIEREVRDTEPAPWWTYQPCPNCDYVGEFVHFPPQRVICNHCGAILRVAD